MPHIPGPAHCCTAPATSACSSPCPRRHRTPPLPHQRLLARSAPGAEGIARSQGEAQPGWGGLPWNWSQVQACAAQCNPAMGVSHPPPHLQVQGGDGAAWAVTAGGIRRHARLHLLCGPRLVQLQLQGQAGRRWVEAGVGLATPSVAGQARLQVLNIMLAIQMSTSTLNDVLQGQAGGDAALGAAAPRLPGCRPGGTACHSAAGPRAAPLVARRTCGPAGGTGVSPPRTALRGGSSERLSESAGHAWPCYSRAGPQQEPRTPCSLAQPWPTLSQPGPAAALPAAPVR